jgi:iron complex outermembrane receptor protein
LATAPLHNGFQIQTGQITSKEIDFDITGHVTRSLTVNANYEYADAKVTKDSDLGMIGHRNFGISLVSLSLRCNSKN